jgi:predicted peroxiredoxin
MWNGMPLEGFAASCAIDGAASVCQAPVGMKQNCMEPLSRTAPSTDDNTSSLRPPAAPGSGFSIKGIGAPAKDLPPARAYDVRPSKAAFRRETTMTDALVIVMTKGIDSELSSVGFTLANGAITSGMKVSVFLSSAAVDLVRRGGQQMTHVPPLDSLAQLIADFQSRGGVIWVCPPCAKTRGYEQGDLIDGVVITGGSAMFAAIREGAATLSF